MVEGRILLAVAAAMQGDTESIFTMMKFAVLPIAKVFVMCFLGFILATKYVNILTPRSRKLLNGLVFTLFLPCLIFTQLGRAVTLRKMIDWWFIPANVVIATITGSIIGFFVATVVRPPHNYFKFTMVQIGVGNIGNVPLVLISAVCQDKGNPFGDSSSCNRLGSAYISFGQWVGAVILYTYVFYMLTPPKESDTLQRPSHEVRLLVDESENLKTPFLQETDGNAYLESTDWRVRSREIYNNLASLAERLKLKQIMQPPIIASVSDKYSPIRFCRISKSGQISKAQINSHSNFLSSCANTYLVNQNSGNRITSNGLGLVTWFLFVDVDVVDIKA